MIIVPVPIDVPLRRDEYDVIRVGKTRVTLHSVIADFQKGSSAEEIAHHYPVLELPDVYLVLGYYLQNKSEIDAYLRQEKTLAEQIRAEIQPDEFERQVRQLHGQWLSGAFSFGKFTEIIGVAHAELWDILDILGLTLHR